MIIKELLIDDELSDGVKAISLVSNPAIESDFIYFNKEIQLRTVDVGNGYILNLDEFWKYTADPDPEIIDTSHEFCKVKAGKVHHISEIKSWDRYKNEFNGKPSAFIDESDFFKNFNGLTNTSFNIDNQIFNCRHAFRRVRKLSDVPDYKQKMYRKKNPLNVNQSSEKMIEIQFQVDKEKHEIVGPALIPNKMIYRRSVGNSGQDGYVYFSKKTIKKIKDLYGKNRTLTIEHESNVTGKAILLDSWIYPDEKNENFGIDVPEGSWFLRYKIIDNKLWQVIKDRQVVGYSIEAFFSFK